MAEPLRALIFDVDGTLAETEELHRRAFNDAFAAAGLDWHWSVADYTLLLRTTGGKERIARFLSEMGGDPAEVDVAALHRDKTRRYGELVDQGALELRPGVRTLLSQARSVNLRVAVATTTSHPNVEALCRVCFAKSADEVFDVIVAGDDVPAKKPAPDAYVLALSRLAVSPAQAVAFEDSANGLRAAMAAGLRCIVSPATYTRDEDFTGALAVIPDLGQIGGLAALRRLVEHCG